MVKIIDIMKRLNPDEVDCLKNEFQEKNKIISELEYKLSEKFKNCYWCEKSDELIRLQEKYEYLEGWHDAVLEESSEYESKIADLEAKLEESEEVNKKLAEHSQSVDKALDDSCDVIRTLKQQLADALKDFNDIQEENDKLAQQLQEDINRNKKLNHEAQKYYEDAYCNGSQNQKAIAELEKVKEWANNMYDGWKSNDGVNLDAKTGICNTLQAVCGKVNQQIAKLKGDK